jgi:hypothetical protein
MALTAASESFIFPKGEKSRRISAAFSRLQALLEDVCQ